MSVVPPGTAVVLADGRLLPENWLAVGGSGKGTTWPGEPGLGPSPCTRPKPVSVGLQDNGVYADVEHENQDSEYDVVTTRISRIELRAKDMVLKEPFLIWLDSAHPPESLLPGREGTAEVEEHREHGPGHCRDVNPQKSGPEQYQDAAEYDEDDVARVYRRDSTREHPPGHFVAERSKCGFSMMPM